MTIAEASWFEIIVTLLTLALLAFDVYLNYALPEHRRFIFNKFYFTFFILCGLGCSNHPFLWAILLLAEGWYGHCAYFRLQYERNRFKTFKDDF